MMSFQISQMGFRFWACFSLLSYSLSFVSSQADAAAEGDVTVEGTVFIDGKAPIGTIDNDFICATLDWWPPEKCDFGTCSWGLAGLLNLVWFFFFSCICSFEYFPFLSAVNQPVYFLLVV